MAHQLFRPRFLVVFPLMLLLVIAVACGDDATATPAPTSPPQIVEVTKVVEVTKEIEVTREVQVVETKVVIATPTPVPTPTIEPVGGPRYGGVVPANAFRAPSHWDPHAASGSADTHASSPMYNQILEYNPLNPDPEIIGDLAESWDMVDDGLAYIFRLKQGAKWWDGRDVTVDDAVFSLNRVIGVIDPEFASPHAGRIKNYIDRVEKLDGNTFKVNLKFVSGAFLPFMAIDAMAVVPKHIVEAGTDIDIFENVVGSGPFMAKSYIVGIAYEYEKNPNYFKDGLPYFDGIRGFVISDEGTELAAFKTEQVLMGMSHASSIGQDTVNELLQDQDFLSKFDIWSTPGWGAHHFIIQVEREPYNIPEVRRAIHLAIDRHELVDTFGAGKWLVGAPMLVENPFAIPYDELLEMPGYRQLDGKKHPEDIAEARRLLAVAGFPDGFKSSMLTRSIEWWTDGAVVIAQQLKVIGIDVEVDLQERGEAVRRWIAGEYDLAMLGYGPLVVDPDDRFQAIYMEGSRNWSRWSDPAVDALFAKQQKETDVAKRKEFAREMQLLVLNGSPGTIETVGKNYSAIVSKRIKTLVGHYVLGPTPQVRYKHEHEWLEPE